MNPDKLQKLTDILKTVNEGLTRTEFVDAFKAVLKIIKDVKDTNTQEWDSIHRAMQKIPDKMMSEMMSSMSATEKKMVKDCTSQLESMIKVGEDRFSKIELNVKLLQSDRQNVIDDTLSQVPKQEPLDSSEQIRNKLESITEEDKKLGISAISHLEERLDEIKKIKGSVQYVPSGVSGGGIVKAYDLTSQLNGVLKTFALPAFWRVISVHSSSTPNAFRPTTDYTTDASAMTITFTDQIDAGSTLATGQTLLVVYAEP